ncbi:MAG: hypothetical protein M3Q76_06220 [Acidobacteriota bacterium]|nr:hypothetical protein [Acidobacteriota bacterium]
MLLRITSRNYLPRKRATAHNFRDESEAAMRHFFRKLLIALLLLAVGHTLAGEARQHSCAIYGFGRELTDVNALPSRLLLSATASLPGLLDELDVPMDVPGECPLT